MTFIPISPAVYINVETVARIHYKRHQNELRIYFTDGTNSVVRNNPERVMAMLTGHAQTDQSIVEDPVKSLTEKPAPAKTAPPLPDSADADLSISEAPDRSGDDEFENLLSGLNNSE